RVFRDLKFLEITCDEYLPIATDYSSRVRTRIAAQRERGEGVWRLSEEESDEFDAQLRTSTLLHLRIETFYLFAQRLLDHLVFAADVILGPMETTLGRHRTLRKNLQALVEARGVAEPPAEFWETLNEVTKRIKDFRDDNVAHTHDPHLTKSTVLRLDPE